MPDSVPAITLRKLLAAISLLAVSLGASTAAPTDRTAGRGPAPALRDTTVNFAETAPAPSNAQSGDAGLKSGESHRPKVESDQQKASPTTQGNRPRNADKVSPGTQQAIPTNGWSNGWSRTWAVRDNGKSNAEGSLGETGTLRVIGIELPAGRPGH